MSKLMIAGMAAFFCLVGETAAAAPFDSAADFGSFLIFILPLAAIIAAACLRVLRERWRTILVWIGIAGALATLPIQWQWATGSWQAVWFAFPIFTIAIGLAFAFNAPTEIWLRLLYFTFLGGAVIVSELIWHWSGAPQLLGWTVVLGAFLLAGVLSDLQAVIESLIFGWTISRGMLMGGLLFASVTAYLFGNVDAGMMIGFILGPIFLNVFILSVRYGSRATLTRIRREIRDAPFLGFVDYPRYYFALLIAMLTHGPRKALIFHRSHARRLAPAVEKRWPRSRTKLKARLNKKARASG